MLEFLAQFNLACGILFTLFYLYRFRYFAVGMKRLLRPVRETAPVPQHRLAVMIAARNEENVLPHLLDSLARQNYPRELFDVFVIADNCTDRTAARGWAGGATVFERRNLDLVGKGYALNEAYHSIQRLRGDIYDAYLVFDADNVLDPGYLAAMNRSLARGERVVTGFRNSKNYGTNWITAGYALWFLYEGVFLNLPRWILGRSCTVSGTGFLVCAEILRRNNGWPFHLLTEDVEFSVHCALEGERIAYCGEAMLFDEQPDTFRQSWRQRMRWCKGFYQVFSKYGWKLLRQMVRGTEGGRVPLLLQCAQSSYRFDFSRKTAKDLQDSLRKQQLPRIISYDIFFTLAPAAILSVSSLFVTSGIYFLSLFTQVFSPLQAYDIQHQAPYLLLQSFAVYYFVLMGIGAITVAACWKQIYTGPLRKVLSILTFPLFLYTYLPISLAALGRKVEWKPIHHSVAKSLDELLQG